MPWLPIWFFSRVDDKTRVSDTGLNQRRGIGLPLCGIGTGTTHRLQVLVDDLISPQSWMGGDRVSPSFMMVSIPSLANRRFGSDCPGNCRCRYTPMCGRLRVGKDFFHECRLVGAPMCSAFKRGSHDRWP